MTQRGFALFDTAIGPCGIAWGERGVLGVQLPEKRPAMTRARLIRRFPEVREAPPPPDVERAIQDIAALLRGEESDLSTIRLDMAGIPPFHRRVYEAARSIPCGSTISYGELAIKVGAPRSARAVGQALRRNPFAIVVPCHRVLAAGGKIGGFTAEGGTTTKARMLALEGRMATRNHGTVVETQGLLTVAPTMPAVEDGALGFDPEIAVNHLRAADRSLARIIDAVGPCRLRLKKTSSVFAALAEAIVYQQLTAKAAATIFGRVCALFSGGHDGMTPDALLGISDEQLREAGLSASKRAALRDLAAKVADGTVPTLAEVHQMDDEAIVERLTKVRGIGRWTVEMLLIFRLGRPDVLPLDDYGVRKGFAIAMRKKELPHRKALHARGLRWKPYRTAASWYLWRAVELKKR